MEFLLDILIIIVLIFMNSFFSGAEIAVITMKEVMLQEMLDKGDRRARLLQKLKQDPDNLFATIQIGVTLVSTFASVYGGARLLSHIEPYLSTIPLPFLSQYVDQIALIILVLFLSYLFLVFGELIPKSLALQYSHFLARQMAYPLHVFSRIFSGFTIFLTFSSNIFLKLFRDSTSFSEARLHEQEIRHLLKEGVQAGSIEHKEQEIISNVFEINDTSAREIMTPRVNVEALPLDAGEEEIEKVIVKGKHTLVPIYRESLDNVEGILQVKDFLRARIKTPDQSLGKLLHTALHVPEGMKVGKILTEMQRRRNYMAIVVDEYGGTAGLITLGDIFEELVGDLQESREEDKPKAITALSNGSYLVLGACPIGEFNDYFNSAEIPESEAYNSVAGYLIEVSGRFPEVGERICKDRHQFELLRRVRQTLVEFRLKILPEETPPITSQIATE